MSSMVSFCYHAPMEYLIPPLEGGRYKKREGENSEKRVVERVSLLLLLVVVARPLIFRKIWYPTSLSRPT